MCNLSLGNYFDDNSVSVQFESIFISIITYYLNCVDFKKVVWSTRSLQLYPCFIYKQLFVNLKKNQFK